MAELTRFYNTFQPNHYDIYLDIDRSSKIITGTTTISGIAQKSKIALHQKDLSVHAVQVDGQSVPFLIDHELDALNITLPKSGETKVTVDYTAPLTDTMMGIYPSYYEIDGEKKQIIGTQFETNFARQAFPCIDEPEAKATFDLAIKFDEQPDETVLANTPELRVENNIHYFDTTVKMSTYLVAFAFGELQNKQTQTDSGVKVGVYATKAHDPKTLDFALDIAKRSIEFFEDFYQTPYSLAQSNQLALPDFSAGAMENWGLVTYREAYLVLDPDNTALEAKQVVATVIAHELAHQWFGDLVTMKWWDDLWLNESFANMMEYVAIDALEPDWHIWELFQTSDVPAALHRDATDGVQAVHVQVNHPAEIDSLFDAAIVYAKGARMLVMVRALIGDDALRQGLKNYFAAHKYGNATGSDLWQALGDASGQDVSAIMNSWLEQPGYPVVSAEVINGKLTLTQQQFFIGEGKDANRLWQIPVNSNYEAVPKIMTEQKVVLGDYVTLRREAGEAFYLNMSNDSHFIVNYDATLLQDILGNVDQLDAITQRQIIQDLHILAQGRQIAFAEIVPLLVRFANSDSKIVNDALYTIAQDLRQFVTPDSDEEKNLKQFYDKLSHQQFERLGWHAKENESLDDELTRPYIVSAALYAENSVATTQAHDLFKTHEGDLKQLPAEIRVFIIRNEVQNYGNQTLFDDLLLSYRQTSDAGYKQDLRAAITSVTDPKLVSQLVATFKNTDVIKPQDLRGWFGNTLRNAHGEQAAWDWLRQDWDWLEAKVGGDMEFTTYITVAASVLKTDQRLEEFKNFFNPKIDQPGLTREIKMDTRVISSRVGLIASEKDAVNQVIADNI
ncbi:M1 family metallopeptidase [uncultured Leuconostoc sp.]|uniref:M1 family metallopeptidase n=1 Tax=uncultured Leuconostoc sp. TaxID=173262 RepID=UPI0025DBFB4E|nr:M1 family metallopeptidase [uncultured Leuconostoc sp.]